MGVTLNFAYALWLAWSFLPLVVLAVPTENLKPPQLRPLVIWHGLGDTHDSSGILEFIQEIKDMYPGIFVHSAYVKEAADEERKAGYVGTSTSKQKQLTLLILLDLKFGNVNEQVEFIAEQLKNITELQYGFDAMGFSQGEQMYTFISLYFAYRACRWSIPTCIRGEVQLTPYK